MNPGTAPAGSPLSRAPQHPLPRFTLRERCARCAKPMLPGQATRVAAVAEEWFVVHAPCAASSG